MTSYVYGVDVSQYQGSDITGWLDGRDFAFVKVTEGEHTIDSGWENRLAQVRSAGLVAGVYHYGHPNQSVTAEAQHLRDTYGPEARAGELIFLDIEMSGGKTAAQATAWKDQFIELVQGYFPEHLVGLYCNTNSWLNWDQSGRYGDALWIAAYNSSGPGIQADWTVWQYTSSPVDTNKAKFNSRAEMRAWAFSKSDEDPDDNGSDGTDGGGSDTDAFPGASHFGPGASNVYVTQLGEMLIARGGAPFYKTGAGPTWTDVDGAAMAAFQTAQGWSGSSADGIPGEQSWDMLVGGTGNDIPDAGGYLPFPSGQWFEDAPNCWIVTAMGERLVAEGCSCYTSGPGAQWTESDRCSYGMWQVLQGYGGSAADGVPGPATWAALQVPGA